MSFVGPQNNRKDKNVEALPDTVTDYENDVDGFYEDLNNRNKEFGKHLINIKSMLRWSNATSIRIHNGIGFVCSFCGKQFPVPADLKEHTINTHKDISKASFLFKKDIANFNVKVDITGLQCTICEKDIETVDDLIGHLKNDHNKMVFTEIKNQILPFKFNGEVLECFICLNKFSTFKKLVEHMNIHARNYICKICDVGYINRGKLITHLKSHDTGAFPCELCPKIFNTMTKKKAHIASTHNLNNRNRCQYCLKTFRLFRQKEIHLHQAHNVVNLALKCNSCDKMFITRQDLRIHTQRYHLLERRFHCNLCEMTFFKCKELKCHMVKHTKARDYQCDICLKCYTQKSVLREHMRIHADDRRFRCDQCGQTFVQKCSWKSHMRSKHAMEYN